jgi:hypothetical protein
MKLFTTQKVIANLSFIIINALLKIEVSEKWGFVVESEVYSDI